MSESITTSAVCILAFYSSLKATCEVYNSIDVGVFGVDSTVSVLTVVTVRGSDSIAAVKMLASSNFARTPAS